MIGPGRGRLLDAAWHQGPSTNWPFSNCAPSLLEARQPGAAEEEEHIDSPCDGCDARLTFLQDHLKELLRHPNIHDPSTVHLYQTEGKDITDLL